jgi:hypothetical protein
MTDLAEFFSGRRDFVFRAVLAATGERAAAEDATAEALLARTSGGPRFAIIRTRPHGSYAPLSVSLDPGGKIYTIANGEMTTSQR